MQSRIGLFHHVHPSSKSFNLNKVWLKRYTRIKKPFIIPFVGKLLNTLLFLKYLGFFQQLLRADRCFKRCKRVTKRWPAWHLEDLEPKPLNGRAVLPESMSMTSVLKSAALLHWTFKLPDLW